MESVPQLYTGGSCLCCYFRESHLYTAGTGDALAQYE